MPCRTAGPGTPVRTEQLNHSNKLSINSEMEIFLIRVLQFMLAISILVLLHEGGHFFFAKLFGIRVEKFYLFFDPWFHLFEFKPKKSHTTYGIGCFL